VTPAVTVLIGSYNSAATLRRAIDSILAQTFRDLELIVVDDGSTDDTRTVTEAVADPRVRYLGLEHAGISPSLNAGLREAAAAIVAVQDADDWSEPERLERQLALLDSEPETAVVGTRMREVDESGATLAPRTAFRAGDVGDVLLRFNPIPNSCAAFRKDAILAIGGYDSRYRYAMDYDLWLRVAERHRVVTLGEELATRRMSRTNVAARKERAQIGETIAIRARALRRRRDWRGVTSLAIPIVSFLTPIGLKRVRRRRLGQAP
jgi:glycosyltransferase involved in cell wall biosynthesis